MRLRDISLLIAGCGIGSVIAECLVRLGCENIILVDGDRVDEHNLNRQCYVYEDVGKLKVESIAKRLRAINPNAHVTEFPVFLDIHNVSKFISLSDVVFDTIDFLSLPAIVALHDESTRQQKPVFSGANVGWGAALMYFPVGGACSFRSLFDLPPSGAVDSYSYTEQFARFIYI